MGDCGVRAQVLFLLLRLGSAANDGPNGTIAEMLVNFMTNLSSLVNKGIVQQMLVYMYMYVLWGHMYVFMYWHAPKPNIVSQGVVPSHVHSRL